MTEQAEQTNRLTQCREAAGPLSVVRAGLSDVEVREGDEDDDVIRVSGHAAVFDVLSEELGLFYRFREKIQRGAFRKALDEDQDVIYLYDHMGLVLSRTSSKTLALAEDSRGLAVDAGFDSRITVASDLAYAMKRGDVKQMSFAFTVAEDRWEETYKDGEDEPEVIRTIVKVDRLWDVSAVATPAYPQTDAQVRSRDIERVAKRFGIELPNPGDPGELVPAEGDLAPAGADEREARRARHREQVAGAKRRLTLAKARSH